MLGAILLRGEQRLRVAFARARSCPAIGLTAARRALALDDRLRRAADEREVAELEEEEIRRRVDAPERPVELERRSRRRPLGALRDHDLEDVALADVLLRPLDAAQVLVTLGEAAQLAAHAGAARRLRLRRFEYAGGLVGIADEHLGDPPRVIEADEELRHDEAGSRGKPGPAVGERHGRLEPRDDVVAEIADDRLAERLRLVEADEARAAADERVPAEPAALHRLEQERGGRALAQAEVRPRAGSAGRL